jgi:nucleoside-diphosphate-sugar epimerase
MPTVLLTGATGFVGGALAARLLQDPRIDRIVALVRGEDATQATERLGRSVRRFDVPPGAVVRLQVVQGALDAFQLPRDVRDTLTHVIHAAAHTSLRSVRTSRETNVEGTRALARAVERAPKLQRFIFVGTAYRCGVLDVPVVDEDMPASGTHVVEYTRTKAEAESILEELGLPLVIARPSIVIGHTRLGVAPSASLFWYYRALAHAGVAPFSDSFRRDIVPVDWVADALAELALRNRLTCTRYHLSAGEDASDTWSAIREELVRLADWPSRSERVDPGRLAQHPRWSALGLHRRTLAALEACARFAALPFGVFSNRRLLAEGVAPPPRFTGYLSRCVETSASTIDEQALDDV